MASSSIDVDEVSSNTDNDSDSMEHEAPQQSSTSTRSGVENAASDSDTEIASIHIYPQISPAPAYKDLVHVASDTDNEPESTENDRRQPAPAYNEIEPVASETDNRMVSIETVRRRSSAPAYNEIEPIASSDTDSETNSIKNYPQKPAYAPFHTIPEEQEDEGDQPMNLALLPLLLLMLALLVSFLLSQYIIDSDDGMPASVSLITSMLFGIAAMITLFQQIWAGKVHLRDNKKQPNVQVNSILRDNLSLVGIIFFCPFACLLDIFQIYTEISCGESWKMLNEYQFFITDVAFSFLHIIFMTLELLFCVQFRRLVMDKDVSRLRRFCVKLSMTVVVAANIGLWFSVVLQEITHDDTSLAAEQVPDNGSLESYEGCLWNSFSSVEEPIRRTLYPFSVEFSLLVLEFFASHLIFNRQHVDHRADQDDEPKPEKPPPTKRRMSLKAIFQKPQCFVFGVTSPLVVLFGVFTNLLSITLSFFSRQDIFGSYVLGATIVRNQQFEIFYWFLVIVIMIIGFASAYNFKACKKGRLQGIDYVVMVSAFGPFICSLIRLIVVAENVDIVNNYYDPTIIWFPEILGLIEALLQLPFMFFADGLQSPSEAEGRKPRWRIFKAAVLSVAMCNITQWLLQSVMLDIDLVATVFDESSWTIIDGIFRPFSIFFRFNSFLILLRAFLL